jgi:hypothetical protein
VKRPWLRPFPSSVMVNDAAASASSSSASRRRASSASAATGSTASSSRRPRTRRFLASCSPALPSRNCLAAAGTQSATVSGRSSTASVITRAWSVRSSPDAKACATSSCSSRAFANRAVRCALARGVRVACDHQLIVDVAPVPIPASTATAWRSTRISSASSWPLTRVSDTSACSASWVLIDHIGRSIACAISTSNPRASANTWWPSQCAVAVMDALFQRPPTVRLGCRSGVWTVPQKAPQA